MTYKARLLQLIIATVVALGAIGSSVAAASEPETPGWDVGADRLIEGAEESASVSGSFLSIFGSIRIGGRLFSLRIRSRPVISRPKILGSCWKCDGKSTETVVFESPELLTQEPGGTKFTAQTGCETTVETKALSAKIWLEGSKAEKSPKADLVWEAPLEGGRSKVATIKVKKKAGKLCNVLEKTVGSESGTEVETKLTLEGNFAAKIEGSAKEEEFKSNEFNFPTKAVARVWQPPGNQSGEETVGLALNGQTASIVGEQVVELTSGKTFGDIVENKFDTETGGTDWRVDGDALTEALPVEGVAGTAKLESMIKGKKVTIECTKNAFANGFIGASGSSEAEATYESCSVKEGEKSLTECKVRTPFTFVVVDALIKGEKEDEDEFKPAKEEKFGEIKIEGGKECEAVDGTFAVKGTLVGSLSSSSSESREHEVNFNSKSKLTLGGEKATLTQALKITI